MADRVGQQLGNYRLIDLVGRGGFAEVYLGEHIHLNTLAAIKAHSTQLTSEEISQFRDEARFIAHLIHPNIVRVLEFDVENNTPFLVMDYAPNGTLRKRHPKGSILPQSTIVIYVKQISSALQYAHDQKLVHRDVKPENMLLDRHEGVLVSDFGIAVIVHSEASLRTQDWAGTAPYMAPEQIKGNPQRASDQYALGIVVYEWLCGVRPFQGSQAEIISQHLTVPPLPLNEKLPTISTQVNYVVLKALAKDPQQRFSSIKEFATALELACQSTSRTIWTPLTNIPPMPSLSVLQTTQLTVPTSHLPSQGELIFRYSGHLNAITDMAWSPDGKYIATTSLDETAQIWNATTREIIFKSNAQYSSSYSAYYYKEVAWSPGSTQVALVCSNGKIEVWDVENENKVCSYEGPKNKSGSGIAQPIHALAWSPTGKNIAFISSNPSTGNEILKVWRVATTQKVMHYKGHSSRVNSFSWSPDGKYIASAGSNVQVWSSASAGRTFTFHNNSSGVNVVAWSPNGSYIALASDNKTVEVWDATTGRHVLTYHGHSRWWRGQVKILAWSPDGKYIASGGTDKTIQIWSVPAGNLISTYPDHPNVVNALAWSPDGLHIASISRDNTVHIWNAITANVISLYEGHSDEVLSVSWSPDGTRIASLSKDRTVQVWRAV